MAIDLPRLARIQSQVLGVYLGVFNCTAVDDSNGGLVRVGVVGQQLNDTQTLIAALPRGEFNQRHAATNVDQRTNG